MSELKRGVIQVDHPGQLADTVRSMDGRADSATPYVEGQRYLPMADGTPAEAIPDGPITGSDYDVEPLNSPRNLARMILRDVGRVRRGTTDVPEPAPEPTTEPDEDHTDTPVGNYVHLDDGFSYLDGQMVPLNDMELVRIQGIIVRAYQRKLGEELKRVKESYAMQRGQRSKKKVQKRKRVGRKALPAPSDGAPREPAASQS